MRLVRYLNKFSPLKQGSVVTIGSFDGLHLGHQQLLKLVKDNADRLQLPSVLITFEPQPYEYFAKQASKPRLMRMREKKWMLEKWGFDYLLCLRFNKAMAELSAEDFIKTILVDKLQAKVVIVGDDFRFGAKRAGDVNLLKAYGKQFGFTVMQQNTHKISGSRVSSTRVREALQQGDMRMVQTLLGHPYYLVGKVKHGDKRGRELGFPTANINLHRHAVPLQGIYAVEVLGLPEGKLQGVANVGTRPTFSDPRALLEVYIFDFDRKIYGENIEVQFLHKIRDEERYDTLEALVHQIHDDVLVAKQFFA